MMGRSVRWRMLAFLLAMASTFAIVRADDDEPRGLGRLFRFGNRNQHNKDVEARQKEHVATRDRELSSRLNAEARRGNSTDRTPMGGTPGSTSLAPYSSLNARGGAAPSQFEDVGAPALGGVPNTGPTLPANTSTRLVPQPRTSRPITEAPPLLTRVQIERSDDGHSFAMFLQIYSDGTVIDTEGVHKVGREVLAPLVEALRASDAGRRKGHCGSPPVDYVESVMLTVFDLSRGRMQANSFSYSGNTQGCDPAIRNLQAAIDAVQAKISRPPVMSNATRGAIENAAAPPSISTVPDQADNSPAPPVLTPPNTPGASTPPLRLTPVDEN